MNKAVRLKGLVQTEHNNKMEKYFYGFIGQYIMQMRKNWKYKIFSNVLPVLKVAFVDVFVHHFVQYLNLIIRTWGRILRIWAAA